jgi:PAS domain S-box-containing protein
LLHLAVQVGGIGIFETDLEAKRTRFSDELCAILGLPPGTELSYAEASRLIDERDRVAIRKSVEAARTARDRGKWNRVCRIVRADGAVRWVSIHGRRIYRDTPRGLRPMRSLGTVIDITPLRQAQTALRESERRLGLALDAARMGTFEADIRAGEVRIDSQQARLLGLLEDTRVISLEELRKRIPLPDVDPQQVGRERLRARHEAYQDEFRIVLPDGAERWLSAHADVRSNRILGVSLDITRRRLAEAALRESEARLRIAAEGAHLGVFEWDPQTDRAVWENEHMYTIFGRTRADGPLSRREFLSEYVYRADVRELETVLNEARRTGNPFHAIVRIKRKGGRRRWLQIDGKFEQTAPGKPARLVGVLADITRRKQLEARTERLSERLTEIPEEERRNIAQELHDSTVQHLVAASLHATSLRPKVELDREQEVLWNNLEASLGEAIKELRTFSYLMHPPALDARGLGSGLRRYIDGFASRTGLAASLRANPKVDALPVAAQRALFRIVQEALANAYRHASASRVTVELRWMNDRLHVVITDDGRGMDPRTATDQPPRPGLGILSMRMRVSELGGRFRIGRRPDGGTRIHAVLSVGCGMARGGAVPRPPRRRIVVRRRSARGARQ